MAKTARNRRSRISSRQLRSTPYPVPQSYSWVASEQGSFKRALALERKDWEEANCSVCMEFPHNAVLLLCSSHEKGCRPYMCGTSYRHSNCLDQFKKAYTKPKSEISELACPLCRGQVKGWTVVEPARQYLDNKRRSCMQDECAYVGTYKELRKHVKSDHPCAKPREVDPEMEEKWRALEHERERQDVISTVMSSMPRSVVFGDYVIEMANSDADSEDEAGDGDFVGGSRGISRSILYFFLREGARLMRFQRDHDAHAGVEGSAPNDSSAGFNRGRDLGVLRSDRPRRRRRRRSRGASAFGIS
ncbi:hypothetical protein KSP39_PZI016770 [Platanthera zijinensis]|uniref:Uncharacterized protein n=1 Tax=Platanthera zijinensis TaxID=2320716 RepID=A0AAP0B6J0_9ASPA